MHLSDVRAGIALLAALGLSACSAAGTVGPTINSVNPNYGTLQFAVGTANLYGQVSGLNVVSTLRQASGASAYGVDTPAITGPFTFNVAPAPANGSLSDPYNTLFSNPNAGNLGPSLPETSGAAPAITGTPETVHPGTPFCDGIGNVPAGFTSCPGGISPNATTFGQSGGVFATGIGPFNTVASMGQSYSYAPYPQPMYETTAHPQFEDWGGPPAFNPPQSDGTGMRSGLVPNDFDSFGSPFFLGIGEGITIFEGVTPSVATGANPYTLTVTLAIAGAGGPTFVVKKATATMASTVLLQTTTAPVVTPDANGDGGASFNITGANFPGDEKEALLQVVDYGPGAGPNNPQPNGGNTAPNCQGAKGTQFAPVYYTFLVTAVGNAFQLGVSHGPNTASAGKALSPSPTICSAADNQAAGFADVGDNITVQIIGFDYPAFEMADSLLANTVPVTPTITGANGQADVSVSIPVEEDYPNYTASPLLRVRHVGAFHHLHHRTPVHHDL